MDCVNHSGVSATAYCQSCGKALCTGCVRQSAGGQVFCEPCQIAWQSYQTPFAAPRSSGPNPAAAAVLGIIPGVGAMYNGQFFKGLVHVVIFALLISLTDHLGGVFGLFIPAWVLYQAFEAFHTAKALRDGEPLPDPLRLNELGSWLNLGTRPGGNPGPYAPKSYEPGTPASGQTTGSPISGQAPPPYQAGYQTPYQQVPFSPPAPGSADPGFPPVPPVHPAYVRPLFFQRKEPIGAIVLIALGFLFLMGQLDIFHGRLMEFTWPLVLIALGVWLMIRRVGDGGPK